MANFCGRGFCEVLDQQSPYGQRGAVHGPRTACSSRCRLIAVITILRSTPRTSPLRPACRASPQHHHPMPDHCWASVYDAGQAVNLHWVGVWCLLTGPRTAESKQFHVYAMYTALLPVFLFLTPEAPLSRRLDIQGTTVS